MPKLMNHDGETLGFTERDASRDAIRARLREKGIIIAARPLARAGRIRVKPASRVEMLIRRLSN
jgi:hypothetical protein